MAIVFLDYFSQPVDQLRAEVSPKTRKVIDAKTIFAPILEVTETVQDAFRGVEMVALEVLRKARSFNVEPFKKASEVAYLGAGLLAFPALISDGHKLLRFSVSTWESLRELRRTGILGNSAAHLADLAFIVKACTLRILLLVCNSVQILFLADRVKVLSLSANRQHVLNTVANLAGILLDLSEVNDQRPYLGERSLYRRLAWIKIVKNGASISAAMIDIGTTASKRVSQCEPVVFAGLALRLTALFLKRYCEGLEVAIAANNKKIIPVMN